jgi:two-component system sensor histidine kinase PilS (NtrC family)
VTGRGKDDRAASAHPHPLVTNDLLGWLYLGRLAVASGILVAALFVWSSADPDHTFLATTMFVLALVVTGGAFFHTHVQKAEPGSTFFWGQTLFDVLLVTGVIHLTGGATSAFAWLYILVISEGALLLPFPGGALIGPLASVLYFADITWGFGEPITSRVLLQVGLFATVAFATGALGDRLRRAGIALGRAQTELHRLRVDTTDILETIATGVITVEEHGRLKYINPAGESLLDIDRREWRDADVLEGVGRTSPELRELLRSALTGGSAYNRREVGAMREGERITLGVSTALRVEPGSPASVTAIFQDITDLEKLADLNRRNERLEAVAELSAAMAHEIRNPLASIRSAVEQFDRPALQEHDAKALTRMIVRESERLSRLLSDFIDFSRVRIGRLELVELDRVVHECVSVVGRHPDAEGKRVRIEVEPAVSGVVVRADADLLHRALFNLVLNAVQFSREGGSVQVAVEDLRRTRGARKVDMSNPIRIRIRDTGPGVPEDQVGRIFDPFFTTRKGGSGLGLSVVHRAVEAHKGVIFVDRWTGGAEFSLYLPGEDTAVRVGAHG